MQARTVAYVRRLALLYVGLVIYGLSSALMVRAGLGLDPWNVLQQGLAIRLHANFGVIIIAVGAALMLLWIPLRQRPGLGTISNVVLIGIAADAALALLPTPRAMPLRLATLLSGILINGIASGMYIGAGLGPGPRDGLMTGVATRFGWSIRRTRTALEISVLAIGWLLGGSVGLGTAIYALCIGLLIQALLPRFQNMVSTKEPPSRIA